MVLILELCKCSSVSIFHICCAIYLTIHKSEVCFLSHCCICVQKQGQSTVSKRISKHFETLEMKTVNEISERTLFIYLGVEGFCFIAPV